MKDSTGLLYGFKESEIPTLVPDDVFQKLGQYVLHWWSAIRNEPGWVERKSNVSSNLTYWAGDKDTVVTYSDTITINQEDGTITQDNPETHTFYDAKSSSDRPTTSAAAAAGGEILIGKYITIDGVLYYVSETAVPQGGIITTGRYMGYFRAADLKTIDSNIIASGSVSYACSKDRNAYPDNGTVDGVRYRYLGVPFDNSIIPPYRVKLKELVDDVGGSNQIDIDVSDINLEDWDYIEIVPEYYASDTAALYVRFNGISESKSYNYVQTGGTDTVATQFSVNSAETKANINRSSSVRIRIRNVNGNIIASWESFFHNHSNETMTYPVMAGGINPSLLKADALEAINFILSGGTITFDAGAKFTIYGVRK